MEEMTFKVSSFGLSVVLGIALTLVDRSRAGVISLAASGQEEHVGGLASSFMHFHGPVEGPEYEVKVAEVVHQSEHNHLFHGQEDEHGIQEDQGGQAVDYVAHPKYDFSYGVEDHHTGDFHAQKESRDGSSVSGEYSVKEPGGSIRVVSYHADKDGFHAVVRTSGKNDHSDGTYGSQHHAQVQVQGHGAETQHEHALHEHALHEHALHEYASSHSGHEEY